MKLSARLRIAIDTKNNPELGKLWYECADYMLPRGIYPWIGNEERYQFFKNMGN